MSLYVRMTFRNCYGTLSWHRSELVRLQCNLIFAPSTIIFNKGNAMTGLDMKDSSSPEKQTAQQSVISCVLSLFFNAPNKIDRINIVVPMIP